MFLGIQFRSRFSTLREREIRKIASKLLKLTETFVDISTVGVKWVHPVIGINVSVGA